MTIVVGARATAEGRSALEAAVAEARLRQLPLVLVGHVPVPRGDADARGYERDRARLVSELEETAGGLRSPELSCEVTVPAAATSPADAIVSAARASQASLIVLGIRRRSRVGKLILGSTAQSVLLTADCPVLAVKAEVDEWESPETG